MISARLTECGATSTFHPTSGKAATSPSLSGFPRLRALCALLAIRCGASRVDNFTSGAAAVMLSAGDVGASGSSGGRGLTGLNEICERTLGAAGRGICESFTPAAALAQ